MCASGEGGQSQGPEQHHKAEAEAEGWQVGGASAQGTISQSSLKAARDVSSPSRLAYCLASSAALHRCAADRFSLHEVITSKSLFMYIVFSINHTMSIGRKPMAILQAFVAHLC